MKNIMEEQLKEIVELHEKNKELYKQIANFQEILAEAEKQTEYWKEKYSKLLTKHESCKETHYHELEEKSNEIKKLEEEMVFHRENESNLNNVICSMENSLSWKLTKPLRYLRWKQLQGKK